MAVSAMLLSFAPVAAQSGTGEEKLKESFRSHRALGGVRVKVEKDVTVGIFGASYFGTGPQYKVDSLTNPYKYIGWDVVPGFSVEFGEIFSGIQLSMGGDVYFLERIFYDGESVLSEYRPRWNVFLTKPLPFGGSVQWGQRFERSITTWANIREIEDENGNIIRSLVPSQVFATNQYRSLLRLNAPSFTDFKITPYVYSEAFNQLGTDFYSETEFGITFAPVRGLSVSLADNFQLRYGGSELIRNHLLCLYAFYTLDLTAWNGR